MDVNSTMSQNQIQLPHHFLNNMQRCQHRAQYIRCGKNFSMNCRRCYLPSYSQHQCNEFDVACLICVNRIRPIPTFVSTLVGGVLEDDQLQFIIARHVATTPNSYVFSFQVHCLGFVIKTTSAT